MLSTHCTSVPLQSVLLDLTNITPEPAVYTYTLFYDYVTRLYKVWDLIQKC